MKVFEPVNSKTNQWKYFQGLKSSEGNEGLILTITREYDTQMVVYHAMKNTSGELVSPFVKVCTGSLGTIKETQTPLDEKLKDVFGVTMDKKENNYIGHVAILPDRELRMRPKKSGNVVLTSLVQASFLTDSQVSTVVDLKIPDAEVYNVHVMAKKVAGIPSIQAIHINARVTNGQIANAMKTCLGLTNVQLPEDQKNKFVHVSQLLQSSQLNFNGSFANLVNLLA